MSHKRGKPPCRVLSGILNWLIFIVRQRCLFQRQHQQQMPPPIGFIYLFYSLQGRSSDICAAGAFAAFPLEMLPDFVQEAWCIFTFYVQLTCIA